MANGVITGQEVLQGVREEINQSNEALKKLLSTYNDLANAAKNFSNAQGANTVLSKKIELDKKQVELLTKIARLEKEKANIVAANNRADGIAIRNKNAQITLDNKIQNTAKRTNSFYKEQSIRLNNIRDAYKSLELKKIKGIQLTKTETVVYNRLGQQVKILDAALKKADAAAGQFNRNVGNYPRGVGLAVSSLRSLAGAFGFTSGIFLFAAAIKDAFNRVREFDKSMQNLAGVLGETRKQIAPIEREVIRVAGASTKTSREVGALAETLATLGKRGQDLVNLIKPANDLSIALQATSDEAAEFLVQTLNAFGEPSSSAKDFAATITSIRTSTTLDFQKMRDSFQYLTPIARILGKDLADTGALIGVLADNGLKAESAGRLLGTALQKIAKEGGTLESALEKINTAQSEGVEGYDLLAIATDLFGKQAAKIGIILANNVDVVERSSNAIRANGTALDDLINEQLESLDAKIKILDSTWERLILTVESGNGAFAQFFKGTTLGITGYLEELIVVEETQGALYEILKKTEDDFGTDWFSFRSRAYDDLFEKQREFNRVLTTIGSDTSLGFLEDELNSLRDVLKNNKELTEDQRKVYFAQVQAVEALYNSNVKSRNELEATAREIVSTTGKFEDFGAKIDILSNEQLRAFISANKDAAKSLSALNNELGSQEFVTLDGLNEKLKGLKDLLGETDVESELFKTLKKEIADLEAEISRLSGNGSKKRKKDIEELEKGTIAYYENQISKERKHQSAIATTNEEYAKSEEKIKEIQAEIDKLTGAFRRLEKVEINIDTTGNTGNLESDFKKFLEPLKDVAAELGLDELIGEDFLKSSTDSAIDELKRLNEARKNGEDVYTDYIKEKAIEQSRFRSQIFSELFGTFASYYNLDLSAFNDLIEGKKGLEIDYAATVNSIVDSLYAGKFASYEADQQANKNRLDSILNDENASDKKKEQAQKEFDKRERELNIKKAKAQREAILFQIAIDTAQTVAKILLNAAALSSNPITAALAANAYGQAALAAGLGLAQAAFVSSQKLPEFYKGKGLSNTYEGWATWGERGREVLIDGGGGIEVSPNATTKRFIKSDDIIVPSVSKFNREIQTPNSELSRTLAKRLGNDARERNVMFSNPVIDISSLRGLISSEIKKGFGGVNITNVNKNYNIPKRKGYHARS